MKYAHLADLHLGSWRDEKMRGLSTKAFLKAIDLCFENQVEFILFAGDLFNTSLPSLDTLKVVTQKLKEIKDRNIPLYVIPGSHDFSPSGKTMIDVLEKAGLLINVCKGTINQETKELHLNFTVDPSGAKITGIIGRKGLLDKKYYENLAREKLEKEEGYKIFMFHTTVTELLPKHLDMMESQPISYFPKKFSYYAGGHIHHPTQISLPDYDTITYTGALFPNNFAELEKYGKGYFYIVSVEDNKQIVQSLPLEIIKHQSLILDCNHKNPEEVTTNLMEHFSDQDLTDTIITIRLRGKLKLGKVSDINFKTVFEMLYRQNAYFVMRNTVKLLSEEFEEVTLSQTDPETVEEETIKEHLQQLKLFDYDSELHLTKQLLASLNSTKKEGETLTDFFRRIESETEKSLGL